MNVSTKYAFNSLLRNARRSTLSILGVGISVAMALITVAWVQGEGNMMIRAAGESGAGHLRIAPETWADTKENDLRLKGWEEELAAVRARPEVALATPRARAEGLLALGNRLHAIELAGVDPSTEQASLRFVRNVVEGRYLLPDDVEKVVVGRTVATRLGAELEDPLVVTIVDDSGEMRSAMLEVVGIVESGSKDMDGTIAHVNLPDLEKLSGLPGAGEIAILLHDYSDVHASRAALAPLAAAGDEVITWESVAPELKAGVEADAGFGNLMIFVVVLVVLLGVTSAQLTAILERRREFAVLTALGMKTSKVVRVIVSEALFMGGLGATVGLALGFPAVYHLATTGLDMKMFLGEEGSMEMAGVMMEPVMYAEMGLWLIPLAIAVALAATLLASIYPAWFAAKTDPADALRVAQ